MIATRRLKNKGGERMDWEDALFALFLMAMVLCIVGLVAVVGDSVFNGPIARDEA